jgi:hypothetical protein
MTVEFVGPFNRWDLVVDGRKIAYLEGRPHGDGQVLFILDGRYGMDVDVAEAERWAPFLAECIAVAAGYTSHPSSDKDAPRPRHPFPRSIALGS